MSKNKLATHTEMEDDNTEPYRKVINVHGRSGKVTIKT